MRGWQAANLQRIVHDLFRRNITLATTLGSEHVSGQTDDAWKVQSHFWGCKRNNFDCHPSWI